MKPGEISAIILAGGLGTRLRSEVPDLPKPLAGVAGRPFVTYLFDQLLGWGVSRAVLCTGYLGEQFESAFGSHYGGLELAYSRETDPLGTGGALSLAVPKTTGDRVLVLNGDSICRADLGPFARWAEDRGGMGSLLLTEVEDGARYGQVETDADGRIVAFQEKGAAQGAVTINAGVYLLSREAVKSIPAGRVSLENDVFPNWLDGGLFGYAGGGTFIDIGVPEDFRRAATVLQSIIGP